MKSYPFFGISRGGKFLLCLIIAYAGWRGNSALYHTAGNYLVSLPSKQSYNAATAIAAVGTTKLINNPPKVTIITPQHKGFFDWNSPIDYTIKVSDVEDGESDQLGIAAHEVFMEVVYLPDTSAAHEYSSQKTDRNFDSPGFCF